MKRLVVYILVSISFLPSCSKHANGTSTVVKPKNHHWWFDRKKDKRKKRTKVVQMRN